MPRKRAFEPSGPATQLAATIYTVEVEELSSYPVYMDKPTGSWSHKTIGAFSSKDAALKVAQAALHSSQFGDLSALLKDSSSNVDDSGGTLYVIRDKGRYTNVTLKCLGMDTVRAADFIPDPHTESHKRASTRKAFPVCEDYHDDGYYAKEEPDSMADRNEAAKAKLESMATTRSCSHGNAADECFDY